MEIDAVYGDKGKKGKHGKGNKGKDKGNGRVCRTSKGDASRSTNRVTPPPGLFSAGTAQSTTGTISTLMEDHVRSGWLCELVVGSDDTKLRENEFVELQVDTGATEHVCGPQDFTHAALTSGPRPALKTATGELLN